jgi:zinc protease
VRAFWNIARAALLGTLALGALTAAAPSVSARFPTATLQDLGTAKLLGESDADAPVSGLQIFVAAGLDRETALANGEAALLAEGVLRTQVDGTPLRDAIAAQGGALTYTVDGRSTHYYLEGRPDNLSALVRLFARALAAPDFSPATLTASRAALTARINEYEASALASGIEMFRRSFYATGAGLPALGTTATIAGLTGADLQKFYRQTYKRAGLSLSAVGRPVPDLGDAARAVAASLLDGPVAAVSERARPIPATAPRVVAHRDVGSPWVVVGFAAPAPASRDFGAMLVLESLLSDAFERTSATTLGFMEKSVGAFYLYDASPASLVVYVNGTLVDPSLALRELLVVSKRLSLQPLQRGALQRFKAAAEGQFLTDSVSLSDRSYLLGTFAAQGLGNDSINAALDALEKTTPADVQRAARAYLQRYIVTLVLPRRVSGP